ncbi:type II toxin-antitoxin system antitoxin SocA domain-containing protein [Clostridioides difficile]
MAEDKITDTKSIKNSNKSFCEFCLCKVNYTVKTKEVIEEARGREVKYLEKEAFCDKCGNSIYVHDINDENLKSLYTKIREMDNIITIKEIESILEKYNIGKRPLSSLLGWGDVTITRYLKGDVPTKPYSDKLRLILGNPNEMKKILEENKNNIKDIAYKKCKEALLEIEEKNTFWETDKISIIAEYIVSKCEEITPLALQKLLYYSQAFTKLFTNNYLFSDDCEAWVHGPVYRTVYEKYRDFGRNQIEYENNIISLDNDIEEKIVDAVIKYFGCYSGKMLERMTHEEKPWVINRQGLGKYESSSNIIEKNVIDEYFNNIKSKYNIINISDINDYSSNLFKKVQS